MEAQAIHLKWKDQLVSSRQGVTPGQDIPIHQLTAGDYTLKVLSGSKFGTARFVKMQ